MGDVWMLHGCCMDDTWMIECEIKFPCVQDALSSDAVQTDFYERKMSKDQKQVT